MRIADDVTTRLIEGQAESEPPQSAVVIGGSPSGTVVPGAVLEAAVRADGCWLLFMTDDTPFEEMLSIHLLDRHGRLLDSALLGGPYSTGSFGALELAPPATIRFRFIGDTVWTVEILPRPAFRLPLIPDAPGVSRKFGFSRHFVVRGKPLPEPG